MYKLSAVTPEKIVFEQEVISIIAPGMLGYLGVLKDHAPLLTPLIPGKLQVKDADTKESEYFISGGFLEVSGNTATILADAIEFVGDIDFERAKAAEQRARERLTHKSDPNIDTDRAMAALQRALTRQKFAKH